MNIYNFWKSLLKLVYESVLKLRLTASDINDSEVRPTLQRPTQTGTNVLQLSRWGRFKWLFNKHYRRENLGFSKVNIWKWEVLKGFV